MPRIAVDSTYCKGCGLCVSVCSKQILELGAELGITPRSRRARGIVRN